MSAPAAETLGEVLGIETVDEDYFWTEKRWKEHRRGLGLPEDVPPSKKKRLEAEGDLAPLEELPKGTVGAVALDINGCIASCTSTGGRTNKLPGRIGDTPIMGAGFWAEQWQAGGGFWTSFVRKITGKSASTYAMGLSGTGDGDVSARSSRGAQELTYLAVLHSSKYRRDHFAPRPLRRSLPQGRMRQGYAKPAKGRR